MTDDRKKENRKHQIAGFVAALALIPSLWLAYCGWLTEIPKSGSWPWQKLAQVIVAVAWTVLPPLWFWFEYFFIYRGEHEDGTAPPPDFDMFKYAQDVSAKIWLAVVASLFVLYFHKDINIGR